MVPFPGNYRVCVIALLVILFAIGCLIKTEASVLILDLIPIPIGLWAAGLSLMQAVKDLSTYLFVLIAAVMIVFL